MFYAERDQNGSIIAIRVASGGENVDSEPLGKQELETFLTTELGQSSYEILLTEADKKMIRVLDDLIEVLVRRNVIMLTDLPPEAREKFGTRQSVRQRMQERGTDITVDDIL